MNDFLGNSTDISAKTKSLRSIAQGGGDNLFTYSDATGATAEQLALSKNHRFLATYLRREHAIRQSKTHHRHWIWQRAVDAKFAPVVWALALTSMWVFFWKVMAAGPLLPPPLPWMHALAAVGVVIAGFGFVVLAMVNVSDPGFIPQSGVAKSKQSSKQKSQQTGGLGFAEDDILKQLDCPTLWAGRWSQLCVSCKIVRPLRAKHDSETDRCIEVSSSASFFKII